MMSYSRLLYGRLWCELEGYVRGCSGVMVNRDGLCFVDFVTLDFAEFVDFTNCYDLDFWVRPGVERFVDVVVTFVGDTLVVS